MRRLLPARQTPTHYSSDFGEYHTVFALRYGENGEFCFFFARIFYHIFLPLSIPFCKLFYFFHFYPFSPYPQKIFLSLWLFVSMTCLRHFRELCIKSHKKQLFLPVFFYCVSFCTKISTKNRTKWIFTKRKFQGIILKLSAAPTPQRHAQLSLLSAEYQSYDINRVEVNLRLCFFY